MADHRCPACGAGVPRGAGFCPACGTAVNAPALPFESVAMGSAVSEREVALGANRPNPRRGALVVAAAAVLLVGGGLIVGAGSGDDDEQVSPRPSTTVARPTTTEDRPTRTTVERTTTSSTVPTYTAPPMPELGGVPLYAMVRQRLVRIDTATGQGVVLGSGSRQARDAPNLMPRQGGAVAWGSDAQFFPDDGSAPVLLGAGELWPAADPALIWMRDYNVSNGDIVRLIRVADGDEVTSVGLPAFTYPIGDDGTGRLMVRAEAGGVFTIDPTTGVASRLSDTSVLAASASHLLLLRCDDSLVCRHELVDRAEGRVSTAKLDVATSYGAYALDPSGARVAIVEYGPEGLLFRVVDLSTGDDVQLDADEPFFYGPGAFPLSWTADGAHLVLVSRFSITVWTPGADAPVEYIVTEGDGDEAVVTSAAVGF